MKSWTTEDDQFFLKRFDAFWATLETIERKSGLLRLDPRQRYWIDTYPPMTLWAADDKPSGRKTSCRLEKLSDEARDDYFSLYFHIGFCRRRCAYCRQYEVNLLQPSSGDGLLTRYVGALKKDIETSLNVFPAIRQRTRDVYFGGGTPSLLTPRLLGGLLEFLLKNIDLSVLSPRSTFEINPEDASRELPALLKAFGMPRLSIGAQSFDNRILKSVGRGYTRRDIFRVVEQTAKQGFAAVNLDVINGFPAHRDFAVWKREIESLTALFEAGLIHSVTLYLLHPFPQTPLPGAGEDACWQTRNLCFAREYLGERLRLFEKPVYWFHRQETEAEDAFAPAFSIVGYGNSSYSSLGHWLLQNEPSLDAFMTFNREKAPGASLPVKHAYRLSPAQLKIRALLFAIRAGAFKIKTDDLDALSPRLKKYLQKFEEDGLLTRKKNLYALTDAGKIFAHQMPVYLFDPAARKSLRHYLDNRFAALPSSSLPPRASS